MRFHLSPEQEHIQDSIRRTLETVYPPQRRRAVLTAETDFDAPSWKALMELGLGGLALNEKYGGSGLGLEDTALALEILGNHAAPGSLYGHVLASLAIAEGGDDALKERLLPKLATGELVGALVVPSDCAPDTWSLSCANGTLNGDVHLVTGLERADVLVVGVKGPGLACAERKSKGIDIIAANSSDLTRRCADISFRDTPCVSLGGHEVATRIFDAASVLLAADALGGAQRMLDMSVEYAKTREQFGVVIGQFQALKHQLANMALDVEPARGLVWYAAHAWDSRLDDASRAAAHAKAHLADRFISVARAAVQAHGGIGYTWDYDLQIWFRRSLFDRAYLGAPSLHRERAAQLAGW